MASSDVKIGNKVWVFRLGDNAIIPAKVAKTYEGSDEIWWESVANASNGKWLTCSHRTNVFFGDLEGAKIHGSIAVRLDKEAAIAKLSERFDKAISEIESFGKENV